MWKYSNSIPFINYLTTLQPFCLIKYLIKVRMSILILSRKPIHPSLYQTEKAHKFMTFFSFFRQNPLKFKGKKYSGLKSMTSVNNNKWWYNKKWKIWRLDCLMKIVWKEIKSIKKCLSNRKCVSHNNSSNKEGLTSSLSSSSVEWSIKKFRHIHMSMCYCVI